MESSSQGGAKLPRGGLEPSTRVLEYRYLEELAALFERYSQDGAQQGAMLREAPARAAEVGRRRFPAAAAEIIAAVVERDLPFYDPVISEGSVAAMNGFARAIGLLEAPVAYDEVVATRFRDLWVN